MENGPFEDVFPMEDEKFHCYLSFPEGYHLKMMLRRNLVVQISEIRFGKGLLFQAEGPDPLSSSSNESS